jgi:hypothetical protein
MLPLILEAGLVEAGSAFALGLAATLFLLGLLAQRELVEGLEGARARRASAALWNAIIPLVGVFALIVVDRVAGLLAP